MEKRAFGNTGLEVSALGFGAGLIGGADMDESKVERLLHAVLDCGINLIDTARGYGSSEERIGRYLSGRRHDFVLSTKVGYGVPGVPDWTYDCIVAGVDAALKRLRCDTIDIVHLHTCPTDVLQRGDVIDALDRVQRAGKVRVVAYAGDNEALRYAVDSGRFGSVIASVNICDQRFVNRGLHEAKRRHMGVIAKRPVANAPWRFEERPVGHYCEPYWERLQTMNLAFDLPWQEIALRFAAYTFGVDSCIVGTTNEHHLRDNAEIVSRGKLPDEVVDRLRSRFLECGADWESEI
ncbi:Aldo/keto reductase [Sulfidibacter corallicola]|uniref:Aldo/keto reductase n=1 Tax=Sulfidibacter corallicola TaxID=2818388 RepID=A0A8A4TD90_SULCO|nr:aldo/keto reductase [Sulfidibacter corallicola]QTD48059.1 aldo/keto reductase [Sulfidibacter corallicola]